MEWVQNYDPLGHAALSSLLAGMPIYVLLGLLLAGASAPRAAVAGLATAVVMSITLFKMPVSAVTAAGFYGACVGLMPIGWIVFSAVFLFQLTVHSGQFDVVKRWVAMISPDRRMQALLIAFCFGTLLEGAAGFGAPVAISAALLIGVGFTPFLAAVLALLANTAPVAFGSLGTPIFMLAKVSGINELALSQVAGRQLPFFALLIPVWLVALMSGWKGVRECWPAILVCGGSYAVLQFLISNLHGPMVVGILSGFGSLASMVIFMRFWRPKNVWRFPDEVAPPPASKDGEAIAAAQCLEIPTPAMLVYAWMPWVLLSLIVLAWGWPAWRRVLDGGSDERPNALHGITKLSVPVPRLAGRIYRTRPVADVPAGSDRAAEAEKAVYDFNWLTTPGSGIFVAAILTAIWLRIDFRTFCRQFLQTALRVRWALATIACMLALAYVTRYSGADATLGLAFTRTGWFYPLFAPLLGWLGVALTGSDTSSNALFGSLQRITAEQLNLNATLIVASNSTGGVMGKMIDAQSIVVAATATGQTGGEGRILRYIFVHSLALALLVGLLTLAQAKWLTWMVP
jgi:lactate permease